MKKKQLYGYFKQQTDEILHEKTGTWLKKRNLLREIEFLFLATQNNAIRTNFVKVKIDMTQHNCKCRLYGGRDETINHIVSKYSKLAQKEYKTKHTWMGTVIL